MEEVDLHFDFERSLQPASPVRPNRGLQHEETKVEPPDLPATVIGQQPGNFKKNYRQTVCTYWLKGLCMKGDSCGFLHQLDPQRMPVCRALLKYGVCKEPDCLFKHSLDDIKECNMYKLGFCIYGPQCRYKHTRLSGPPPNPEHLEAAKPREYRNINIVVNEVNPNIATGDLRPIKKPSLLQGQAKGSEFGSQGGRYIQREGHGELPAGSVDSGNNSMGLNGGGPAVTSPPPPVQHSGMDIPHGHMPSYGYSQGVGPGPGQFNAQQGNEAHQQASMMF